MPDDSGAANLDVTIRTSADLAGATAASAALDQVAGSTTKAGDAAEGAGAKNSKLVEDLQGYRGGTRAARELFEVLEGGRGTVEGLAGLMRMLVITTEGLAPEVAIAASLGLALVATFAAHSKGADEAKQKTDTAKTSLDDLGAGAEKATGTIAASFAALSDGIKTVEDADKREGDQLKAQNDLVKERIELEKKIAENRAKQEFLAGIKPDTSDEEIARRKKHLDAQIKDIEDESTVNTAKADYDATLQQLSQAQKDLADARQAVRDLQEALNQATDAGADARNLLEENGLTAGPKDDKTGDRPILKKSDGSDFGAWAQKQLDSGQEDVNRLREDIRIGNYLPKDLDNDKLLLSQRQAQIDKLNQLLISLREAARNYDDYPEAKAKADPAIAEQETKITALNDKIDQLQQELQLKGLAVHAAIGAANNNKTERNQDTARDNAKAEAEADFKDTKARVEAEIKSTQNDLDTKSLAPWQREYAERAMGVLKAYLVKLEADYRKKFHDVVPGEDSRTEADAAGDINAGNKAAQNTSDDAAGLKGKAKTDYDEVHQQLADAVDKGEKLAQSAGLTNLVTSINRNMDLNQQAVALVEKFSASYDTKLTTYAQKLAGLEAKVAETRNQQ